MPCFCGRTTQPESHTHGIGLQVVDETVQDVQVVVEWVDYECRIKVENMPPLLIQSGCILLAPIPM